MGGSHCTLHTATLTLKTPDPYNLQQGNEDQPQPSTPPDSGDDEGAAASGDEEGGQEEEDDVDEVSRHLVSPLVLD